MPLVSALLLVCCGMVIIIAQQKMFVLANTETLIGIAGKDFVLLAADTSLSGGGGIAFTSRHVDKIQTLNNNNDNILIGSIGDSADARVLIGELSAQAQLQRYESGQDENVVVVHCGTNTTVARAGFIPQRTTMTVDCLAELARYRIASALRRTNNNNGPLKVNLLIAGWSDQPRPGNTAQPIQQQVNNREKDSTTTTTQKLPDTTVASPPKETTTKQKFPALFWLDEYGSLRSVEYGAHGYASQFLYSILDNGYRENLDLASALTLLQECLLQLKDRYLVSVGDNFCIKCLDGNGCRVISSAKKSNQSIKVPRQE